MLVVRARAVARLLLDATDPVVRRLLGRLADAHLRAVRRLARRRRRRCSWRVARRCCCSSLDAFLPAGAPAGHRLARPRLGLLAALGPAGAAARDDRADVLRARPRPGRCPPARTSSTTSPSSSRCSCWPGPSSSCCCRSTRCGSARCPPGEYWFLLLCSVAGALDARRQPRPAHPGRRPRGRVAAGLRPGRAAPRTTAAASEAALKLFLVSVVSTAVMLFGLSLVYGVTGAVLPGPDRRPPSTHARRPQAVLLIAAWSSPSPASRFKVAAVPFHFWAPDTYEGAPVPVAAYLSVVSKAAGFVGLAAAADPGLRAVRRRVGPDARRARRADHDRRQPGRAAADARRSGCSPGRRSRRRLHAGAARRGRRRATSTTCCRRRSPTCWPTRVMNLGAFAVVTLVGRHRPANRLDRLPGAGPHRAADGVRAGLRPGLPGRAAAGPARPVRQGRRLPGAGRPGHRLAGRRDGGQRRDRALLLPGVGGLALRSRLRTAAREPAVVPDLLAPTAWRSASRSVPRSWLSVAPGAGAAVRLSGPDRGPTATGQPLTRRRPACGGATVHRHANGVKTAVLLAAMTGADPGRRARWSAAQRADDRLR